MMYINNAILRRDYEPNTFIGGVANTITSASEVASILNVSVSGIKAFSVVDNDIQFHVKNDYEIPSYAFQDNTDITYYRDEGEKCFGIGQGAFMGASELEEFKGLAIIWVGSEAGGVSSNGSFRDCVKLKKFITSEAWINCNRSAFNGCTLLEEIDFSTVSNIRLNGSDMFKGCKNLPTITINPLYTGTLGGFFEGAVVSELNLNNVSVLSNRFFGFHGNRGTVLFGTLYSEQVTELGQQAVDSILGGTLEIVNFPNITEITAQQSISRTASIKEVHLTGVTKISSSSSSFTGLTGVELIDLRKCKEIENDVTNHFSNIKTNCEVRFHEEIDTNLDVISYLLSRNAVVKLYDDNGDYVSTL